jgi:hypothetical protein
VLHKGGRSLQIGLLPQLPLRPTLPKATKNPDKCRSTAKALD